jgi:hypothetical protein
MKATNNQCGKPLQKTCVRFLERNIKRRTHLAAINVQMQIEIDPAIEIQYLYGHDLITDINFNYRQKDK